MSPLDEILGDYRKEHPNLKHLSDDDLLEVILIEIAKKSPELIDGVRRGPDGKLQFRLPLIQ
jgi:hypothetical protein